MSDQNEIEFVDGLMIKEPREGAPDFVKASISIKRKDLGNWLRNKEDDWINIDVKVSRGGKWYCSVDNWKPTEASQNMGIKTMPHNEPETITESEEIPF